MRVLFLVLILSATASAQSSYLSLDWSQVKHVSGAQVSSWRDLDTRYPPRVVLDGPGEAYVSGDRDFAHASLFYPSAQIGIFLKLPLRQDTSGIVSWVGHQGAGRGRFLTTQGNPETQTRFEQAQAGVLGRALLSNPPGAPWLRHRLNKTASGRYVLQLARRQNGNPGGEPLDLLTGGRAVSENLQLERNLGAGRALSGDDSKTVETSSLSGITIRALDWSKLLEGIDVPSDALARCIPADQYAVFFPNFTTAKLSLGAVMRSGTPILQGLTKRAQEEGILQRYTHQLGISLESLATELRNYSDVRVALTGSDSQWALGTDVALIFWTKRPRILAETLFAHRSKYLPDDSAPGFTLIEEELHGVRIQGLRGPLRRTSSFVATLDDAVVFSNSRAQLERLIKLKHEKSLKSVDDLEEYQWFRHRYPRGAADESAFLFISDPAIRRWCSPAWRIGAARRLQAAAELSDLHAQYHRTLVHGQIDRSGDVLSQTPAILGRTILAKGAVHSSRWNTLEFLTPVSELDMRRVTKLEAREYELWRRGYQRNWTNFDPVGLKLSLSQDRMAMDLTVMPLIIRSQYREYVDLARGATIADSSGDRHPNTALQFSITLNPDSSELKKIGGFLGFIDSPLANPLSWLGDSVTVYVDEDAAFFAKLASLDSGSMVDRFLSENIKDVPAAFHCEVKEPMKLALFLTSIRAYVEGGVPDLATWTTCTHNGSKYVRIGFENFWANHSSKEEGEALFYSASKSGLLFSFNEPLLKRHLDRIAQRKSGAKQTWKPSPYLGAHLNGQVQLPLLQQLSQLRLGELGATDTYRLCFSNLPILNTWKRLYPDEDPVSVHERIFGTRLVCPSGGTYTWNQEWRTMQSTVLGHPAGPRTAGIDFSDAWQKLRFGITFENGGLRAKAELTR